MGASSPLYICICVGPITLRYFSIRLCRSFHTFFSVYQLENLFMILLLFSFISYYLYLCTQYFIINLLFYDDWCLFKTCALFIFFLQSLQKLVTRLLSRFKTFFSPSFLHTKLLIKKLSLSEL
jgi:hypothetical protein